MSSINTTWKQIRVSDQRSLPGTQTKEEEEVDHRRYLASHREQESSKEESHDIRSERLKERDRQQCLEAGQTVKRMTREDKQANIRERASQAEDAANRRGQGQVYNITNLVSRKYHKATDTPIVDNQGRLLTMEA